MLVMIDRIGGERAVEREREYARGGRGWRGRKGINHTDPNTMSLSASFPGATLTISLLVVFVVVVVLAVDILLNCSAAFLSLVKVVRLLLTESVIRTPLGGKKNPSFFFLNLKKVCMFKGVFFSLAFLP